MRTALPSSLLRHSLTRQALRQQRLGPSKRFASSTPEQKAQDALASAQKNAEKVFEIAKRFLGPVGEKAGNMLGSYKQPLLYNLAVTKEVVKQVYLKEGLQPPSLSTVSSVYSSVWTHVTTPGFIRNIGQSGDLARIGIYGLQAYGIFKIGEIVGRRSVIGYNIH